MRRKSDSRPRYRVHLVGERDLFPHSNMYDERGGGGTWFGLESDAHPAVALVVSSVAFYGDSIGESKKRCFVSTLIGKGVRVITRTRDRAS